MYQRIHKSLLLWKGCYQLNLERRLASSFKLHLRSTKYQRGRIQKLSNLRFLFSMMSRKIKKDEPISLREGIPEEVRGGKNELVDMETVKSTPGKGKQKKQKATPRSSQQLNTSYPENFISPKNNPKNNKIQSRDIHRDATPIKDGLPKMNCIEYWAHDRVSEGLEKGELIQGMFRINQKNFNNAYITAPNNGKDILIEGFDHRNRALHGDVVAIQILEDNDVKKNEPQSSSDGLAKAVDNLSIAEDNEESDTNPRGRVVRILDKKHSRMCAGNLKPYKNGSYGIAMLSPMDSRLPRLMIPLGDCPESFKIRPQDFGNFLFVAEITNWKRSCGFAAGKLVKNLGEIGEIETETEGFLIENNIDFGPFPDNALACLPDESCWHIAAEEYENRRDFRTDCVFTIDPTTARDLDDALSCKINNDGNFEIGVHIADVSFFIEEDSELDKVAAKRATSVYLVQKVIPMLPRVLCEHLCSLNPAQDKLTYSVVWTITPEGNIKDEWFGRSVIRSCSKLTYDHAQQMIDAVSSDSLDISQFPAIDGNHSLGNIHSAVKNLHSLSILLRKKRFEAGALFLDQPKLTFLLNSDTGLPNGCGTYVPKESNRLVEEFMLLTNMAVAHRLIRSHPDKAFLRRHPTPNARMLEALALFCKRNGINLDIENSRALHQSLELFKQSDHPDKEIIYYAIMALCSKPMQLAKYFCAGALEDENLYHHYALSVPLYTHFTSPIRRYADVIVHRLLTAALDQDKKVKKDIIDLQQQAEYCNDKKIAAKRVQELSSDLFFNIYMKECGELKEKAVIIGVLDSAVDVLLLSSGQVKRIYCNSLPLEKWDFVKEPAEQMVLIWKNDDDVDQEKAQGTLDNRQGNQGKRQNNVDKVIAKVENRTDKKVKMEGPKQTLRIFQKIDIILKSTKKDGSGYKTNIYLSKPES